jgi:DNA-binding transcriptional ArsR family regulator
VDKVRRSAGERAGVSVRLESKHMFVKPKGRKGETRAQVASLLERGLTLAEIARTLAISKPTVSHHARMLRIPAQIQPRYDWQEVQRYYDAGHSITDCQVRFGFARATFVDAAKRGVITTRSHAAPIETYLVRARAVNRTHLKRRLVAAGLKENRCERCGIDAWLGEPLSMALHHVNGDGLDNRLENLALLCPNCHAQTPNFSGRNRRIRRIEAALQRAGARRLVREGVRELPVLGDAA